MSDSPEALARAAQEQRQRQLAELRAAHDERIAKHREAMAEIERRAAASVPTPTQEEADLAALGLIGPEGFASGKDAAPEPRSLPRAPVRETQRAETPPPIRGRE
jgi:hypothetical protein